MGGKKLINMEVRMVRPGKIIYSEVIFDLQVNNRPRPAPDITGIIRSVLSKLNQFAMSK